MARSKSTASMSASQPSASKPLLARLRLRLHLLALALTAVLLPLAGGAACALTITGPSSVLVPGSCFVPQRYTLSGAIGAAAFDARIEGSYNVFTMTPDGILTLRGNYDSSAMAMTITAADASGATASMAISLTSFRHDMVLPPLHAGSTDLIRCDPSVYRTYWAYDMGNPFSYTVVLPDNNYNAQATTRTEDTALWLKVTHYGTPTIKTVMNIPRNLWATINFGQYTDVGYGPNHGQTPIPADSPWQPTNPWNGVTASYDAVYPYPTPDRVMADGGTTYNADPTLMGVWPRGIEYAPCCELSDFSLVDQLVDGYSRGFIAQNCQNGNTGVFVGPYGYCGTLEYDTACHHYDAAAPVATSACLGSTSSDALSPVPQPWPKFSLAAAWTPTPWKPNPGGDVNLPKVDKVFAAPTASQIKAIEGLFAAQGIDLSRFNAVPSKATDAVIGPTGYGNDQILWQLDGRNTFFCDHVAWQSSRLLMAAPYLVNGIYCNDTDTAGANPAPAIPSGSGPGPTGSPGAPGSPGTPGPGCPVGPLTL